MSVYRIIFSYLTRNAGPVSLNKNKIPYRTDWHSGKNWQKNNYTDAHRNYLHFMKDHRTELTEDEHNAVDGYRDEAKQINNYLRGLYDGYSLDVASYLDKQVDHISSAINKNFLKRPVVLWRGISFNRGEPITEKLISMGVLEKNLPRLVRNPTKAELDSFVGFKFKEPAFVSTSLGPEITERWPVKVRILMEKGQTALATNSSYTYSQKYEDFLEGSNHLYEGEHEFLLDTGTVFQVESARLEIRRFGGVDTPQLFFTVRVID